MKKKILAITILALALCMALVFAKPVMAAEACSTEGCAEGCQNEENCTAECCPVLIGDKCYPTLEAAINAATNGQTITLRGDVTVNQMVKINKQNVTLDLNKHKITASASFSGSDSTGHNDQHLINIEAESVTVKNGSLVTTEKNKHGINVYGVDNVTLADLKIDHTNSMGGAPIVVNGSTVKVEGNLNLILGTSSWYGINVDPKKQDRNKAELTFENDSIVSVNGNENQLFMYMDPVTDGKQSAFELDGETGVSIQDGKGNTTYYVGLTGEEVAEVAKAGATVTVMKGEMALENLADNVTVKTEGTAKVTVNGYEVTESGVDTSVLNKLKELEALLNKLKEELNNQGIAQEEIEGRLEVAEQLISDQDVTIAELQEQIENLQAQYKELKGEDKQGEQKEKDNTPKTGSANVALIATVVSAISLAGIVTVKKYTK